MSRETFIEEIEEIGFREDEYGRYFHDCFPEGISIVVYDYYYTFHYWIARDREIEFGEYDFLSSSREKLRLMTTDWNIDYFEDISTIISNLNMLRALFRANFDNINDKNLALFKQYMAELKAAVEHTEKCLEKGAFNV